MHAPQSWGPAFLSKFKLKTNYRCVTNGQLNNTTNNALELKEKRKASQAGEIYYSYIPERLAYIFFVMF